MAVIDSGAGMPADASSVLEINNLAAAQSEVNQMLVGYTRSIFNNTPSKPQSVYTEGDEIVFDFPASRDFINIAGSQLMFDLDFHWKTGAHATQQTGLGISIAHIFDRLIVYNGSTKIEQIDNYGKYCFHELKTKTVSNGEYLTHGYVSGCHPVSTASTSLERTITELNQSSCMYSILHYPTQTGAATNKNEIIKVIFPLKTIFERSGYLPIGNIFKGLQFRFKIDSHTNFAWLSEGPATTLPQFGNPDHAKVFEISNPVWKMDSLKYSLGSMPALGEHVFHTFGTQVNRLAIEATTKARYILDYNWSSLKRCVSFLDPKKNTVKRIVTGAAINTVLPARVPMSQGFWDPSKTYQYEYNAGTVRFPEDDPVETLRDGYYHYLKSVHMQDVAADLSDSTGGFNRDFDIATGAATLGQFFSGVYMCAKFDKLDQSASVISGTDVSSRYVILNVEEECDTYTLAITKVADAQVEAVKTERYVIANYDAFIIIYGGAVAIQD